MARIRWASSLDVVPLARLWHDVWHHTYAQQLAPSAVQQCGIACFERRVGASLFEHDASLPVHQRHMRPTALVAENSDLRGFAVVRGGAEIDAIYVLPEEHGMQYDGFSVDSFMMLLNSNSIPKMLNGWIANSANLAESFRIF